ncbi:MAG: TetR/AcrR family transcriptional regulator [Streptomycetales bacterium]
MSTGQRRESGRERVIRTAYDLFSRRGVRAVGIDTIIAEADVAKMTLYRNFPSKDALILAFLQRREERWVHEWLLAEIRQRESAPGRRLLAIFDVFAEWFARSDYAGCPFVTTLLEIDDPDSPVRKASAAHMANIRNLLGDLAAEAGIGDTDRFARQWHILMKGSIVAAQEGDQGAAGRAREMGGLLLRSHGVPT